MNSTRSHEYSRRARHNAEQYDAVTEQWRNEAQSSVRRTLTKRSSRNNGVDVPRDRTQKSRKYELVGKKVKLPITVDTSFTTHRGHAPSEVHPGSRNMGSIRNKLFSPKRASTNNKGLGISKGTPQLDNAHRTKQSIDQNDPATAISLEPGKMFPDISPWDRRIPIGFSVPTESVPDFSSYQGSRLRAGSDATLVTPSIVVTPAGQMQSVWSPDTPFTESDYAPSIYGRTHSNFGHSQVPPVPALPADFVQSSGKTQSGGHGASRHNRSDTLDSAGTAFEEDDDTKRKDRIMSSSTVFEEDTTPLQERSLEMPIALDSSLLPTPTRQSQEGWWNFITTPFVTTPNTATWPKNGPHRSLTPNMPMLPSHYYTSEDAPASPSTYTWSAADAAALQSSQSTAAATPETHSTTKAGGGVKDAQDNSTSALRNHPQQTTSVNDRGLTSPLSAMSASPVVSTAALGTVLMPRQVEEPRQININIELQDRRPIITGQAARGDDVSGNQPIYNLAPAIHLNGAALSPAKPNTSQQTLPTFAPPPTFAQKSSHFSYDNQSRSSSPTSSPDLKAPKKHRKVCGLMSFLPSKKGKQSKEQDGKDQKKKKKRGVCFWGCCCCLILLILLAILIPVIVVVLRKHNGKPTVTQPDQDVSNQWLNLPNYPPMPTGISTIAQPEIVEQESGCVAPTTLWSCALPKELQQSIKPNKPTQPNFKVKITYENGSNAKLPKRAANPVSAGAFIRARLLQLRSAISPSPAPPNDADMTLLGKTTDGNSAPFNGETTPLFISFQDPQESAPRLAKRVDPNDPTNITAVIPPPMLASDGTAAPANLLPFPSSQPLRLFNRGKDNEYYGFFTYFDRSIFLKDVNGTNRGGNPADVDGGSTKDAAKMRCTYSETRFFVQIWTQSEKTKPLLQRSGSNATEAFKRPGTFPYPITITMDRHGGNPAKKNLYCYSMESDGTIKNEASKRFFQFEDRGFGGNLVNSTQGRANAVGPIDGGSGGCRCKWQNWSN